MSKVNILPILFPLFFFMFSITISANVDDCGDELVATELIKMCDYSGTENLTPVLFCGDEVLTLNMGPGCEDAINMNIYFVNLLGFNIEPITAGPYYLPTSMDDLYVEYDSDFDGVYDIVLGPFDDFYYNGQSVPGLHGSDRRHYIFEHNLLLPELSFPSDPCDSPDPTELAVVNVRLSQKVGEVYETFELQDYSSPQSVASCEVFHETCGYCQGGSTPSCSIEQPVYEVGMCVDCYTGCGDADERSEKMEETIIAKNFSPTVNPNPFYDEIDIEYTNVKEEAVSMEILDIRGVLLQKHFLPSGKGTQRISLELSDLSEGIYFCKFQKNDSVQTVKMIKSN